MRKELYQAYNWLSKSGGNIKRSSPGVWGMKDRMGSHKRGKFQACRGTFESHCLKIPLCRDYVCHIVLDAINLHPSLPPT